MITREQLVVGAQFIRNSNSKDKIHVEILGVGRTHVFIRHLYEKIESRTENTWTIAECLNTFLEIPPPKKSGTMWMMVFGKNDFGTFVFTSKEAAERYRDQIRNDGYYKPVLAIVEVPWEEGEGL